MSNTFRDDEVVALRQSDVWGLCATDSFGMVCNIHGLSMVKIELCWQGMDLTDVQVVVQWWASCNLMTLWQRLGWGARDCTYTATAIFLVEKDHFDGECEKKRVRKLKKQNTPLQPITNKRVRTTSNISQRAVVDNVEGFSGSSDESETEELTSVALTVPVREEPENENSRSRKKEIKISQLRHRYSTTVSAPRKKKSDPLEPAMDDLVNAQSRKLGCRRIPFQAYLEMSEVCTCRCQLSIS